MSDTPRTGGAVQGLESVGEDGCTLYALPKLPGCRRLPQVQFDASPEAMKRLLDGLRATLGAL